MAFSNSEQCKRYRENLKKRVKEILGTTCVFCQSTEDLQIAHIVPTGINGASRGLDRRYLDVIKNPGSHRTMCKHCHKTFDKLLNIAFSYNEEPIPF